MIATGDCGWIATAAMSKRIADFSIAGISHLS
jgi:hypothetical protein